MEQMSVQLDFTELPDVHTCRGRGLSPRIRLGTLDPRVSSLAVIAIDPFEPGCSFVIWLAAGLAPAREIPPGIPAEPVVDFPVRVIQGTGDGGRIGWQPPCAAPEGPPHQVTIKVYGLDTVPPLEPGFNRNELVAAMRGHIVQFGSTIALVR
ncbi:MAG TPA: YbhB/YbcL family Raf kinase inhibitor-like protein [Methanoregulaceae archaeon]|nr:YbhB/YbcL family Raf kinase inhibitor-like protein [Methanoregulaceae archaeon]